MDNYFFENAEEEIINTSKYLIFSLEDEKYALDIFNVVEIINFQDLIRVPDLPEYIVGIFHLRDRVYPIMDLRIRFKKPYKEYNDQTCIVLVEFNDMHVGIIVDDILEVSEVNNDQIMLTPKERTGFFNKFIKKLINRGEDDLVFIIDCDLLFINEIEYLKELNNSES